MDILEFSERIIEEVSKRLPDDIGNVGNVIVQPILKNNGVQYMGLVIVSSDLNISPTIYLEPFYNKYRNGAPLDYIVDEIIETYSNYNPQEDFDVDVVKDWDSVKDRIIRKLVNYEKNDSLLNDVPHKKVAGLAVVYQIYLGDIMGDYATILLQNNLFESYDVTLDELDELALKNTKNISNYSFNNLSVVLEELMGQQPPFMVEDIYMLSNEARINGAVHIIDPEVQDKIAETIGNKYWMIPSSIHEVLILPYNDTDYSYEELEMLIEEVNETQLDEDEVLSYKAYVVDAKNHILVPGSEYAVYEKTLETSKKQEEQLKEEKKGKDIEPEVGPKL